MVLTKTGKSHQFSRNLWPRSRGTALPAGLIRPWELCGAVEVMDSWTHRDKLYASHGECISGSIKDLASGKSETE